ncbi:WD40 repeat-like protein, partial [Daedalea quercina L-15889]
VLDEKWSKRPLIVSGSRDDSLRVWTLPRPEDADFYSEDDTEQNPYHKLHLGGHDHAVRDVAARGRTIVSGSYDCTVRVWDIVEGTCKWVLVGHTQKVYSVALDIHRDIAGSGSIDSTVRVWDIQSGQCRHVLRGHTLGSLVGLLSLSSFYAVSASSDSTVRVWSRRRTPHSRSPRQRRHLCSA